MPGLLQQPKLTTKEKSIYVRFPNFSANESNMASENIKFKADFPQSGGSFTPDQGQNSKGQPQSSSSSKEAALAAFAAIASELKLVEERISSRLTSEADTLSDISTYLHQLGGKRIRPIFALLTHRLLGQNEPTEALIDLAAGVELIHMATLLHDDIIDQSPTRRRQASAYYKFGLPSTLLTGDFLLVRAFGLCARLDNFVIEATENACVELTEGEILEGVLDANDSRGFDDYLNIISKKTASLFALACSAGGYLAGAQEKTVNNLRTFGYMAGNAFQMVDDVLDIIADEDLLGKPSGTDLKQRTPSLVNILWLRSGDPFAKDFFGKTEISSEDSQIALKHLQNSEIIDEAKSIARQYATLARDELLAISELPHSKETLEHMMALVDYTIERCH